MARYRIKRKLYGIGDAVSNTLGGVTEGVGKAMDTKLAGGIGAVVGGSKLGGLITGALGGASSSWWAGPAGILAGAALGAAATRGIGKGLKSAGQELQS